MNEEFRKLKGIIFSSLKRISIPLLIACIIIVILAAIQYFIDIDDGSYKKDDKKNTPYAVEQHTSSVNIDANGEITTAMTAQELWDKMLEDGSRVDVYLKSPEELQKLTTAQMVTDYLDTRPNPNEPIDWESFNKDVNSKNVQGIIKLKRSDENGNVSLLTYVDSETFQSYIDEYNNTGSDTAKKNALSHFTLEKSNGGGSYKTGTDGIAKKIEKGDVIEIPQGQGYGTSYTYNSWQLIGGAGTPQLKLKQQAGTTFDEEGFARINGGSYFDDSNFVDEKITSNDKSSESNDINKSEDENEKTETKQEGESTTIDTTSEAATFYAKVATWDEVTEKVTSDDPEQEEKDETQYSMTTTKINYQQLVSGYKMPFDYLWALLVISQDKDFVFELADLVYNSEIEITVYDNITENTNIMTDTYTKATKVITSSTVDVVFDNHHDIEHGGPFTKEKEEPYTTTTTIITKTNTLNIAVTKANVWIVNYSQEFERQLPPEPIPVPSNKDFEDEEYPSEDSPEKQDSIDAMGLAEEFRKTKQIQYEEKYKDVKTNVRNVWSKYYYKTINRTVNNSRTTKTTKYISSPAVTEEKTDKESKDDNFVTIYIKNSKAKNNINSASSWLFEILENSPDTVDMVDLTKYLLYKATGRDYGVTEYDIQGIYFGSVNKVRGNALENYIKLWENAALWKYETGQSSNLPSNYLSEDEKNYIVYEDGSKGHNNVAYGIATFIEDEKRGEVDHPIYGKGYYNWKGKFDKYGIDVATFATGSLVDRESVTIIFREALEGFQNYVENFLANNLPEYEFSREQKDSLTAVCYQYGNINSFPEAYRKSLNEDGSVDPEKIRREFYPFNYTSTTRDRKYANWVLFTKGKYINAAGQEVLLGSDLDGWDGDYYSNDKYTFPVYNQYDPRWVNHSYGYGSSEIGPSGCGCCATAMIISGYTGELITPDKYAEALDASGVPYYGNGGSGPSVSSDKVINQYGCSSVPTGGSKEVAMEALEAGYAVLGGENGHFLAFVPVSREDAAKGYKFRILDSARGHNVLCRDFSDADKIVDGNSVVVNIIYPFVSQEK